MSYVDKKYVITRTTAFWDTHRRPMITHTSESHQITSQKKTFSESYTFKKNVENSHLEVCKNTLRATRVLKLLDKTYADEMDPIRTVGAALQSGHRMWDGRTNRRTDGRTKFNVRGDGGGGGGGVRLRWCYNYAQSSTQPPKHHGP